MPEGPDGKTIIIVKKVSGHGGGHGGAWKVAYADFVTAMMALFMVLWLVNSASEPTRQRIASYFRKPGIFEKGSGTPLQMGGGGILPESFAPPAEANSQVVINKKIYEVDSATGKIKESFDPSQSVSVVSIGGKKQTAEKNDQEQGSEGEIDLAQLKAELDKAMAGEKRGANASEGGGTEGQKNTGSADKSQNVQQSQRPAAQSGQAPAKPASLLGQVDIKVDQRGLLLEIMDTDSTSMFELGQASIKNAAQEQLLKIAKILAKLPNPIDIEGHTDARPYRGRNSSGYDNWDLSIERANAARRILQQAGIEDKRIARVVGYADQRPRIPADPLGASNRRITIAMRFSEQAKMALEGTKTIQTKPQPLLNQSENMMPKNASAAANVPKQDAAYWRTESQSSPPEKQEKPGQLRIDVGTTMPEGAPVEKNDPAVDAGGSNRLIEKDKIFGEKNPFFTK